MKKKKKKKEKCIRGEHKAQSTETKKAIEQCFMRMKTKARPSSLTTRGDCAIDHRLNSVTYSLIVWPGQCTPLCTNRIENS